MARDKDFWGDLTLKREALKYIWDLSDYVRSYLTYAVEYVNDQAGESKEDFWKKLFIPSKASAKNRGQNRNRRQSILEVRGGASPDHCPANPYRELDLQAVCKFLKFGRNRDFPQGTKDDSRYYYDFFLNGYDRNYRNILSDAIRVRNQKNAHITDQVVSEYDREAFENAYNMYFELTQCLARRDEWRPKNLPNVDLFWLEREKEKNSKFGATPIALEMIGQELFSADELSDAQRQWLNQTAAAMRLQIDNGKIYEEPDYGKLLEEFRELHKRAAITKETADEVRRTVEENRRQQAAAIEKMKRREAGLETPVWKHISDKPAKVLHGAGYRCAWNPSLWNTILDSFAILVDETVFAAPEGREMLRSLVFVLSKRKIKLNIDASVITSIFRQLRTSRPYTALQLAEMNSDEIEQMQEERSSLHQRAKTAIKTLRYMRECGCIEVAASPTDSRNSYENIRYLVRLYPHVRFLVLTMDRQLVQELADVKSANAVAAKPDLDHNLLFFRATRNNYDRMLERAGEQTAIPSGAEPVQRDETAAATAKYRQSQQPLRSAPAEKVKLQEAEEKAQEMDECLPVREEPKTGDMVKAVFADKNSAALQLGKFISDGGEGRIYETSGNQIVAKLYLPAKRRSSRLEKLKKMVAAAPEIKGLCWPCALLYNQWDEWIGFLMPRAHGVELAKTVFSAGRDSINITQMGWSRKHLVRIAVNIAHVFSQMHEKQILMGDINPRNFMVQKDCTVCFVDCDSYQFGSFACPVFLPLFLPPEIHIAMKNGSQSSSGFLRTEQNERYSLAVLLFEILMLGKAPYESRNTNNEDIIQAIIEGEFLYPYQGRNEGENVRSSCIMPPAGKWRNIWNNMPYLIKTDFYDTFAGSSRHSAAEWEQHLEKYYKLIAVGRSSDELMPAASMVICNPKRNRMLELTCSNCGKVFRQTEAQLHSRQFRQDDLLCEECRSRLRNFHGRKRVLVCDVCKNTYEGTVADWIAHDQTGKSLLCPKCARTENRCSKCGRIYRENRTRLKWLREHGRDPLCEECFHQEYTAVACSQCGNRFVDKTALIRSLQRQGSPLLCPKCRRRNQTDRQAKM